MRRKNRERECAREREGDRGWKWKLGTKRGKSGAETSELAGRSSWVVGVDPPLLPTMTTTTTTTTTTTAAAAAAAKKLCLLGELLSLSFARFRERPGTDLKTNEGPLFSRVETPGLRGRVAARR